MNKKWMAILIAVIAVVGSAVVQIESKGNQTRVHQHLTGKVVEENIDTLDCIQPTAQSAKEFDPKAVDVSKLQTHLPLVVINVDQAIPGVFHEEVVGAVAYSKGTDEESTVKATMKIMDEKKEYHSLDDAPTVESSILMRVRGNSSRLFDKKSYFVRTVDQNDQENDLKMMGMEKGHDWALHGPFLDKSLMRNYLGMNISGMLMDYAPDVRFCEVIINGDYQGLYVMMETIGRGKGRVDIEGISEEKNLSGYIMQFDTNPLGSDAALENFTLYTYVLKENVYVNLEYPGKLSITPELKRNIEHDISKFEKALYSFDHDTPDYGFKNYVDFGEFVDYFILMEVFQVHDTGRLSTYYYKNIYGKIKPCVWDFNNAADNYSFIGNDDYSIRKFITVQAPWFWMMTKEEEFTDAVISRYKKLRKGILSDAYLDEYINETVDYLGTAITRNNAVWGYSFDVKNLDEYNKLFPDERNPVNYDGAVTQLKTAIYARTNWLDQNIEVLKQYSHESAVKKFNH